MSKLCVFIVTLSLVGTLGLAGQNPPAQTQPPPTQEEKKASAEKVMESAASSPGAAVDPKTFMLGAEDIIFVRVWHDNDFTGSHMIRPDGRITLPLVGEIQAAGMTPVQLGKAITEKLSALIKEPQVDVTVAQVNSKKYFIQGEVNKSGQFPLVLPTTVMEALSNCGGFRDFANKKKIVILRKGQRLKFNYQDVVKGKNTEQNILLENGDYIIVP